MSPSAITILETTLSLTSINSYYENSKSSYLERRHNGGNGNGGNDNGVNNPKQLIGKALKERVESIDHDVCEPGEEDTFFVADLGEVYRQHMRWKLNLPRVKPFYGEIFLPQTCDTI
jgi:ornithine decarboxylase